MSMPHVVHRGIVRPKIPGLRVCTEGLKVGVHSLYGLEVKILF